MRRDSVNTAVALCRGGGNDRALNCRRVNEVEIVIVHVTGAGDDHAAKLVKVAERFSLDFMFFFKAHQGAERNVHHVHVVVKVVISIGIGAPLQRVDHEARVASRVVTKNF